MHACAGGEGSQAAEQGAAQARRESYVAKAASHVARARLDQAVARLPSLPNPGQEFEMRWGVCAPHLCDGCHILRQRLWQHQVGILISVSTWTPMVVSGLQNLCC